MLAKQTLIKFIFFPKRQKSGKKMNLVRICRAQKKEGLLGSTLQIYNPWILTPHTQFFLALLTPPCERKASCLTLETSAGLLFRALLQPFHPLLQ
jgi:hypothetical protein